VGLLEIWRPHPATVAARSELFQPAHRDFRIVRYVLHRGESPTRVVDCHKSTYESNRFDGFISIYFPIDNFI